MNFNRIQRPRYSQANITKTVTGSKFNALVARYTLQGYMLVNVVSADTGAVIELTGGVAGCSADVKPDVTYTVTLRRITPPSSGILF